MSNIGKTIVCGISRNGTAYSDLLQFAFKQICSPHDWKAPIKCTVPNESASLYREAIVHITGTVPTCERLPNGDWQLTSVGYRNGPCGDH